MMGGDDDLFECRGPLPQPVPTRRLTVLVRGHHRRVRSDRQLQDAIRAKLAQRSLDSTICPSEVARDLGGDDWRQLMEPVRAAARRLVDAGAVEITQGGVVVDPRTAKGPIRIGRPR